MTSAEKRGQAIVWSCIAIIILLEINVICFYVESVGTERLPKQIVRFLLTVALCYWLFRGSLVAKWILIVLSVAGALLGLAVGYQRGNSMANLFMAGLAVIYLTIAGFLAFSPGVNAFLACQRTRRRSGE